MARAWHGRLMTTTGSVLALLILVMMGWTFLIDDRDRLTEDEMRQRSMQQSTGQAELVERDVKNGRRSVRTFFIDLDGEEYACTATGLRKDSRCVFSLDDAKYFYRHVVRIDWIAGHQGRIARRIAFLDASGREVRFIDLSENRR